VNSVGNLICFPLPCENEDKILIVGGLNIGLLSSKSHIFDTKNQKINYHGSLEIPIPDISRFNYRYRDTKIFVVGQFRIQEFDLEKMKWNSDVISYGI
jgi:hypothetical protein